MICAEEDLTPISPKSMSSLYAGFFASGKASALMIVPTRMSTCSKSAQLIVFIRRSLFLSHHPLSSGDRRSLLLFHRWLCREHTLYNGNPLPLHQIHPGQTLSSLRISDL